MLDEFTYLLTDFTSCKFSIVKESNIQVKNTKGKKRISNLPSKKFKIKKNKFK
jgi:hypothetical protein